MRKDESPWHNLEEEGAVRLRPGLAGRVLAEAGRRRAAKARALRQIPQVMVLVGLAAILGVGGYLTNLHHLAAQREEAWAQVAAWTQDDEID